MAYNNPTVDEFKAYFTRDFPYDTDPAVGVTDNDIGKAFGQTNFNINQNLFSDQTNYTIAYMYLAAHWLVIDLRMASQGIGGTYEWLVNSKNVGSVSVGLTIPQRILDNPELAMLSQTNYGAKYLQLILPMLGGQMMIAYGSTRP